MKFKRTIASLLLCGTLLTSVASATTGTPAADWTYSPYSSDFSDIPKNAPTNERPWYYVYVYSMADKGFITGRPDGTFDPHSDLSLAEFCAIIANGFLGESLLPQLDAGHTHWWESYLHTMNDRNCFEDTLLDGVPSSQWSSYIDVKLTRYEVAAILSNLLTDRRHSEPNENNANAYLNSFRDFTALTVSSNPADLEKYEKYKTKVAYVALEKLMFGDDDGNFAGDKIITRAEVSAVLNVLIQKDTFVKSPETLADAKKAAEA